MCRAEIHCQGFTVESEKHKQIERDIGGRNLLARFHLSQATLSHPTNPNSDIHTKKTYTIGNSIMITQVSHTPQKRKEKRDLESSERIKAVKKLQMAPLLHNIKNVER